jgi:hypothetical protein
MKFRVTKDIRAVQILKGVHVLIKESGVHFEGPSPGEVQHADFQVGVPELSLKTTLKIIARNEVGDKVAQVTYKDGKSIFGLRGWRMRMKYGLILNSNGLSIPDALEFSVSSVSNPKRDVVNR